MYTVTNICPNIKSKPVLEWYERTLSYYVGSNEKYQVSKKTRVDFVNVATFSHILIILHHLDPFGPKWCKMTKIWENVAKFTKSTLVFF